MSKFKVGDQVVGNAKAKSYSITKPGWKGTVVSVDGAFMNVVGPGAHTNAGFAVRQDCFDLVRPNQKIVVTTDGVTTTARLFSGKELVNSATAKCAPADEFDFKIGAGVAVSRLLNTEEEAEPEKLFPLEEIKAGYLLKVRDDDGSEYFMTVAPGEFMGASELACCCPGKNWWPVDCFGSALCYEGSTVLAVYGPTCNSQLLANTPQDRKLLWSRK